jgi:hypothetical protein
MYTVLMVAALAVGSGDGRGGAADGRTVEKVPPYTKLRVGMSADEVTELLGFYFSRSDGSAIGGNHYCLDGPLPADVLGYRRSICIFFHDERVVEWKISSPERRK